MRGHELYPLWNLYKSGITKVWPDGDQTTIAAAERVIAELHEFDKSSEGFRYLSRPDGEVAFGASAKKTEWVNLCQMRDTLGGLFNFLSATSSGILEAWQTLSSEG